MRASNIFLHALIYHELHRFDFEIAETTLD